MLDELKKDLGKKKVLEIKEMKKISVLANRQVTIEKEIEELERELDQLKTSLEEVSTHLLPDALAEAGVSTIKLESGESIVIKKIYAANLNEMNQEKCFNWLKEHGHEALVSHEIGVKFKKGEDKLHEMVSTFLQERKVDHSDREKIHPQTLQAFIREQVEGGAEFPLDLFQVSIINKAKVK